MKLQPALASNKGSPNVMTFSLAEDLQSIVKPGVIWFDGATVVERSYALDAPLAEIAEHFRRKAEAAPLTDTRGFRLQPEDVRTMYKRVGLDPTKRRPSSEALLRRVRKGEPLPRINTMVDVCNWCSLEFQLPYGLYDAAHIDGDRVELRLGREG